MQAEAARAVDTAVLPAVAESQPQPQKAARSSYLQRYGKGSGSRVNPLVAAAVVIGLLVMGIGGAFASGMFDPEDAESPSIAVQPKQQRPATRKPLNKKAFVAKADALCGVANSQMDAMTVPTTFDPLYLTQVIEINTRLVRNLRQLPPPSRDERKIDRMLTGVERALGYMILTVKSAREGSAVTASRSLTRAQSLVSRANKIAKAYGFEECSEPA